MHISGHPNAEVYDCVFSDCLVAVNGLANSNISVHDCIVTGGNIGVAIDNLGAGSGVIYNCTITGQNRNSIYIGLSDLSGYGNNLQSAGAYTIGGNNFSASFHGNHILKGTVGLIELHFYHLADMGLDFTNNWWGIADADSIADWIHDGSDDPDIQALVRYEPFADGPVSTEQKGFGDMKRLFR